MKVLSMKDIDNDKYEIINKRLEKANKALKQFEYYDIDTLSAMAILESNKKEIQNMLIGFDRRHHYSKIIYFLLEDNGNMDRKTIDRYLMIHMFIFPDKVADMWVSIIGWVLLLSIPIALTTGTYLANIDDPHVIGGTAFTAIISITVALFMRWMFVDD